MILSSLISSGTDRPVLPLHEGCHLVTQTAAPPGSHAGITVYDVTESVNANHAGVANPILPSSVRHSVEGSSIQPRHPSRGAIRYQTGSHGCPLSTGETTPCSRRYTGVAPMGIAPHGSHTGISPLSRRGRTGVTPVQLGRGAGPASKPSAIITHYSLSTYGWQSAFCFSLG